MIVDGLKRNFKFGTMSAKLINNACDWGYAVYDGEIRIGGLATHNDKCTVTLVLEVDYEPELIESELDNLHKLVRAVNQDRVAVY